MENKVFKVVLLQALPASGKSEVRNFMANIEPQRLQNEFHIGKNLQLDDFPYVHMMRRIDNELQAMGEARIFYPGEEPFIDGRDWGTLCALLNEDYHDLMNRNVVKPDSAAQLLFDRYDRAGLQAGISPRLGVLKAEVREKLAKILENEARAMLDEKHAGYPDSFEDKTIIIECARGGPDGSSMPLSGTFGYQYSLPMFCPEILENAVILYESDYKTRYAGFNPNSAESYIIFEFMQDKYMSQSVHLASLVQKHFRQTCKRTDRGVHQAGFLVLKASAMPSILVELGFISTPEEERYLNTEAGTTSLANGIFRAFLTYKREQEIRLNGSSNTILPEDVPEPVQEEGNAATATPEKKNAPQAESNQAAQRPQRSENAAVSQTEQSGIVFKIQILTSSRPLAKNDKRLKGLKDVDYYKEGGIYKYTYGASPDYNKVLRSKRSITDKFKDAFIIAFKNGEKINVNTAISEFKKNRNK